MKKIIILLMLTFACTLCLASSTNELIKNSKQLMIVSTLNLNAVNGQLQRFERNSARQAWKPIGNSMAVVMRTTWNLTWVV